MRNFFTKILRMPLAVVGASETPHPDMPPSRELKDATGGHWTVSTKIFSANVPEPSQLVNRPENQVLPVTFSSVPIVSTSEINLEYAELGEALAEMTQLELGDEWKIDQDVYQVACQVAIELSATSFPAPQIFSHGPKSVVFNWTRGNNNLYLTISSDYLSALVSSPERIKRRLEFSTKEVLTPALVFRALLSAPVDQPVVVKRKAESHPTTFVE